MSKLSFRARALDASKPMPIYLAEELPDLPDYSAINRAVPQMPSGMEKEEESEHHLQRAISGTGLIIPTPEVCEVADLAFYERCYPADYKMPKQHIHMQPLWEEQETPEYDIDSEDERWLKQQHYPQLTELVFEQMIDKLERCSGHNAVTLDEAKLLLQRADDAVVAVYDYWLNKRLTTLHPLILSVKTDSRPGQSTNNPYLAFRRRTEKMQTRKNRKNDETSYEKMVKLRRELARALSLLRLVARREQAKRELVRLTGTIAERRHRARDYSPQPQDTLRPPPPPLACFRREFLPPPYAPRPPVPDPRQREKRPYKRRKHRHHTSGVPPLRGDSGVYTSSEEESAPRAEPASPYDDGPFAFRRKAGCYYEMPTSTLCGDPVEDGPSGIYQHDIDRRHRFTLVSISEPYTRCIGFGRRRLTRGGRVAIDRVCTPLDDLWGTLPAADTIQQRREEVEFETKAHRSPKEMVRDYHTSGKYPWRHAFRRHLNRKPHLWTVDVKTDADDLKTDVDDIKLDVGDLKLDVGDLKLDVGDLKTEDNEVKATNSDLPQNSDISYRTQDNDRQVLDLDSAVKVNLDTVLRERSYSPCSDSSEDSDGSLYPVEQEFDKFISEVNRKWPHYRPRTPPRTRTPTPPPPPPLSPLRVQIEEPSSELGPFITNAFSLDSLHSDLEPRCDFQDALMQPDDPFASGARPPTPFGSSVVRVIQDKEPLYISRSSPPPAPSLPPSPPRPKPSPLPRPALPRVTVPQAIVTSVRADPPKEVKREVVPHAVVQQTIGHPLSLQQKQLKLERMKPTETEGPLPLPTVPKTPTHYAKLRPGENTHILTVALNENLKVRLQNHLAGGSSGAALVNGPYTTRDHAPPMAAAVSRGPPLSLSLPLPAAPRPLVLGPTHTIHHLHHNKLKVLHAHPLSSPQRSVLTNRVPAVVSMSLVEPKQQVKGAPQTAPITQLFEIKGGQLGKGTHLVNVVRPPQPGKTTVARLDLNDAKTRQVVAAFEGSSRASAPRPQRVAVSVDGRQLVRAPHHHIHLNNRTFQLQASPRTQTPSTSMSVTSVAGGKSSGIGGVSSGIPSAVVANLLHHKHMQLPKGGQKIAISSGAGQALAANVQAIALNAAQLKARQARLIGRPPTQREIVESAPSTSKAVDNKPDDDSATNGVRRRAGDTAMEVT